MSTPPSAGSGRYSRLTGVSGVTTTDVLEIRTSLADQGNKIAAIQTTLDSDLSKINSALSSINLQVQNLVTKDHCERGRQDLKDRMDGKRDVTGANMRMPEAWSAYIEREMASNRKKNGNNQYGLFFWIAMVAATITIVSAVGFSLNYVVDIFERQERTENVLRAIESKLINLSHDQEPPARRILVDGRD
jgi:hypothetical protein